MKVIKQAYFESKNEGQKLKSRTILIIEVEGELYTEVVFLIILKKLKNYHMKHLMKCVIYLLNTIMN